MSADFAAAVQRIAELLSEQSDLPEASDPAPLPSAPEEIQFENVSFAYDDSLAIQRISFRVAAGETIGIAGPSGAGKSTLLNLVARFYDATSGVVRFDGRDLRQFRLADVHDKLAIVTQQPFLFSTTDTKLEVDEPAAYGVLMISDNAVLVQTEDFGLTDLSALKAAGRDR